MLKNEIPWNLCGPPFLNGSLHAGHGVLFIIKDFTLRYQKQILKQDATWYYNFDCHGLPVERVAEKTLKENENMVDKCLSINDFYYNEAKTTLKKLNLLNEITQENCVLTNNIDYKIQVMNFISELYDQKKLYKTLKHALYCYHCNSFLANAQVEKKRIQEKIYLISAELIDGEYSGYNLLFATTELETVYHNVSIGLNPSHLYGIKDNIISGMPSENKIYGAKLEGAKYKINLKNKIIYGQIICSKQVHSNLDDTENTILSTYASVGFSPWGGKVDYNLVVEENKLMSAEDVKEISDKVNLQRRTILKNHLDEIPVFKILSRTIMQEVCWRCSHKVGHSLSTQWCLKISPSDRAILSKVGEIGCNDSNNLNQTRKFFEQEVDWNVSRSRTFGTPMPLVECSCGEVKCIYFTNSDFQTRNECFLPYMEEVLSRKKVDLSCKCGSFFKPIKFSLDVWLDSGFLPLYSKTKGIYPTLIEGIDQKRGWFYTTAVLSVLKNGCLPYKNLYYTGWILNNNRKVSKSNNTLGSLDELIESTDLLNLRSYALTNANSSNTEYSLDLVNSEKKYINCILNAHNLLNTKEFIDIEPDNNSSWKKSFKMELDELSVLTKSLEDYFLNLQYDKYWNILKNHFLKIYSRVHINNHKRNLSDYSKAFLKYYGFELFRYINPVLGTSL